MSNTVSGLVYSPNESTMSLVGQEQTISGLVQNGHTIDAPSASGVQTDAENARTPENTLANNNPLDTNAEVTSTIAAELGERNPVFRCIHDHPDEGIELEEPTTVLHEPPADNNDDYSFNDMGTQFDGDADTRPTRLVLEGP